MAPRFRRGELDAWRGASVPDVFPDPLRLLFVGINPGLWTAAAGAHFARPGNRFWPALHLAGITSHRVDASRGMPPEATAELEAAGVGITNLVHRATARADELDAEQLRAGARDLVTVVAERHPVVVAILGLSAFRTAFGAPRTTTGRQADDLGGAQLWVLPNPSGLNAHETVESLARWYRDAAGAAGVPLHPGTSAAC